MSKKNSNISENHEDQKSIDDALAAEELQAGEKEAAKTISNNDYFRRLMNKNFLEYASYVIKDRAIPNVDDGLKPVQRRILWAMHKVDDGGTKKAAFVVGEVMGKYHPHGDASIKDALVVIANKEYFIKKQGNFGNIISGSNAAAPRYIECGLTDLAREVLYNDDITPMVDTYDGRNLEPIVLPVKIPSLLMLGSDGIAVGMKTTIMPHNFNELLKAQIAVLNGESFELYPDFLQGGIMDVSEYADGNGKITVRAKIEIDGRELVIREIPATTTTESLMNSIEKAAEKNKIKITSVRDFTAEFVEIRITPTRGYDVNKALDALYMYTDCSVSISVMMTVIRDNRPCQMTVTEVINRNTEKLLAYLKAELEIDLHRQNELYHAKTLAQLFFENRIYKRIEECGSEEEEYREVEEGLAPFLHLVRRELTHDDIDKLLALPVRRIARFDIEKNQRELSEIDKKIAEIKRKLAHLKDHAIKYLTDLLEKYGDKFPRRTEIVDQLEKIDRRKAALNNIKIGWDKKSGYIGTAIKSDDVITCNEFDHLLMIEKNGKYKVINLPGEKLFVGKLYECRKYDPAQEFAMIYIDSKTKKYYAKRTKIDKFITDKDYMLCPNNCKIEFFTPRVDAIYELLERNKRGTRMRDELNLMTLAIRSPKARGMLLTANTVEKVTHIRYLTPEEIDEFTRIQVVEIDSESEDSENENTEVVEINESIEINETTEVLESTEEPNIEITVVEDVTEITEVIQEMENSAVQVIIEQKSEVVEVVEISKKEKPQEDVEILTLKSEDDIIEKPKKKPTQRPRIVPKKVDMPRLSEDGEELPPLVQPELF